MSVFVRFECGCEDRMSEPMGPYPFAQLTYDTLRVGADGETDLAYFESGWWWVGGERWSDVVIFDTHEVT